MAPFGPLYTYTNSARALFSLVSASQGDEMSLEEEEQQSSCCISHQFHSAASRTPDKIAVVNAAGGANLFDLDRARISSYPPVYEGDECFTYADILSAVESFSRCIRHVLDGGDDPALVRSKGQRSPSLSFLQTLYGHSWKCQHEYCFFFSKVCFLEIYFENLVNVVPSLTGTMKWYCF